MKLPLLHLGLLTISLAGNASAVIVTDGSRDGDYGAALSLQTNTTGFGDATTGDPATANGSELDALYAQVVGGNLHLLLTGNLESNFNKLDIYFDSTAGGQNTLSGGSGALNNTNGLTFDTGFTADFFLSVTIGGSPTNSFADFGATGGATTFIGGGAPGTSITGSNGINVATNNSNTGGVSSIAVNSPGSVLTGVEFLIPLSVIGSPASSLRVSAMINSGDRSFLSNQVLGGLPLATANLGAPSGTNFNNFAGNQFVTIPVPEATSGMLALLAALGLTGFRRRR